MVSNCPSTSKAITERSTANGCDSTYRYHCMRTKEGSLTEQCLEISWIQDGNCAIYNAEAQRVDAEPCNENLGICPQKQYLSNDVMSYSACVDDPEVSSLGPTSHGTNATSPWITSTSPSNGSQLDNTTTLLILVAVLALVAVIATIAMVIIYKSRNRSSRNGSSAASKRHDEEKELSDPGESTPLNTLTDSNESSRGETRYDFDSFHKTRTCEYIEKLIEDSAVSILIIGHPGSGKSILAEMIHDKYCLEEWCRSVYMKSLEDVGTYDTHDNKKMIYIVDDCFEDWVQYPHLASDGIGKLKEVHKKVVEDDENCLVITISKWNYEQNFDAAQKAQLEQCDKLQVIDLTSKDYELDITDKTGIIEYHRKKSRAQRLDDKELRKVTDPSIIREIVSYLSSDTKLEFEFPLSCRLFYSHESFVAQKEDFFNETKRKIRKFVKGLSRGSSEEKNQYCSLIYVTLCGGQIERQKNHDISFLEEIAKAAKIDLRDLDFNFDCCLIIKGNQHTCDIVHAEITKLLFSSFGFMRAKLLIDNCNTRILLKFIRSDDSKMRNEYRRMGLLVITNNVYDHLFSKLQRANIDSTNHAIFKDDDFRKKFERFVGKTESVKTDEETATQETTKVIEKDEEKTLEKTQQKSLEEDECTTLNENEEKTVRKNEEKNDDGDEEQQPREDDIDDYFHPHFSHAMLMS